MKKTIILAAGFLLIFSFASRAQVPKGDPIQLKLEKGDELVYEISTLTNLQNINNTGDVQNRESNSRTRFRLVVKEVRDQGVYLLSYKHLFTKSNDSDSRFPNVGHSVEGAYASYLNTVEYSIIFDTHNKKLSVANLDEVRSGLYKYLESRGIQLDHNTTNLFETSFSEKNILDDLLILNFYPGKQNEIYWQTTQNDGNIEKFKLLSVSDSGYLLRSEIPDFFHRINEDGSKDKGYRVPRELNVDMKAGILLEAASVPKQPETKMNYFYTCKLLRYSAWESSTFITGSIEDPGIEKLCLEYPGSIVGRSVDQKFVDLNPDGSFSIPLELENPVKYRLYFLKKHPINSNKSVHLYVEPGDSIHLAFAKRGVDSVLFSGRGFMNSEFLNRRKFPDIKMYAITSMIQSSYRVLRMIDQYRNYIDYSDALLESEKNNLTPGFYSYMYTEVQSFAKMFEIGDSWKDYEKTFRAGKNNDKAHLELFTYFSPLNDDVGNLEIYPYYINLYSNFRLQEFQLFNNISYGSYRIEDQLALDQILLGDFPLYADLVNLFEDLSYMTNYNRAYFNNPYLFEEALASINNQEVNEYIAKIYRQVKLLQPGQEMPMMELLDLNGKKWDWKKTKGKIVVLMLHNTYEHSQNVSEDIYKEYGQNKKDVIVLRVSPGISFEKWKKANIQYSNGPYFMYFTGGEITFTDMFILTPNSPTKYIVIDKNGKIVQQADYGGSIRARIEKARATPPPPKKPFFQTMFGRILPGALLGMLLSILLYRIIIYRRIKRYKQLQKMTELEQKALKAQLNPHFLFNCLNSIQHLIRTDKRKEADAYLSSFATLIRKILNNSEKESVSVSEEIETLKLYMELEQMRFSFQLNIEIDPTLDIYNTMIPTMLLQPVVENAILHGLDPKKGDKMLIIKIVSQNDSLLFIIDDNGIGREASAAPDSEKESKGLGIIESRIDLLNRTDPGKYELKITDKKDDKGNALGTTVEIIVPDEK